MYTYNHVYVTEYLYINMQFKYCVFKEVAFYLSSSGMTASCLVSLLERLVCDRRLGFPGSLDIPSPMDSTVG